MADSSYISSPHSSNSNSLSIFDIVGSAYSSVVFHGIQESYSVDSDIECQYQPSETIHHTDNFIGLFPVTWKSLLDCVLKVPCAYTSVSSSLTGTRYHKVCFSAKDLPKDVLKTHYQFVYMTWNGDVKGVSTPFRLLEPCREETPESCAIEDDFVKVEYWSQYDLRTETEDSIPELSNTNADDSVNRNDDHKNYNKIKRLLLDIQEENYYLRGTLCLLREKNYDLEEKLGLACQELEELKRNKNEMMPNVAVPTPLKCLREGWQTFWKPRAKIVDNRAKYFGACPWKFQIPGSVMDLKYLSEKAKHARSEAISVGNEKDSYEQMLLEMEAFWKGGRKKKDVSKMYETPINSNNVGLTSSAFSSIDDVNSPVSGNVKVVMANAIRSRTETDEKQREWSNELPSQGNSAKKKVQEENCSTSSQESVSVNKTEPDSTSTSCLQGEPFV